MSTEDETITISRSQLKEVVTSIALGVGNGPITELSALGINHVLTSEGIAPFEFDTFTEAPAPRLPDYNGDVLKFHQGIGGVGGTIGETADIRTPELRADLVLEEAREFAQAVLGKKVKIRVTRKKWKRGPDLAAAIDGICDILYVTHGAAIAFGVKLPAYWNEVQRTNMLKLTGPVRADGKRLKPEGWKPPRIADLLALQRHNDANESVELTLSDATDTDWIGAARTKSLQENA